MKIRSGFVSNSSSSSFVIAFDESKFGPCPHCGRKDQSIIDLIERSRNDDDTKVVWRDPEDKIRDLKLQIDSETLEIKKIEHLDPKMKLVYCTVEQNISWMKSSIYGYETEISKIEDALKKGLTVAEISISYHDDFLNSELSALCKNGKLEILKSDD
jgi:hypothetical protein